MQKEPRTPRGPRYEAKYLGLLKRKLDIPRNKEGEPNTEYLSLIRTLHRELSSQEGFIGVAPKGSAFRGYNLTKEGQDLLLFVEGRWGLSSEHVESDFDVAIFYDSSVRKNDRKLRKIARGEAVRMKRAGDLHHKLQTFVYDLNPEIVRFNFQHVLENFTFYAGIIVLCDRAIGPGVEKYRRTIGDIIRSFDRRERDYILRSLVDTALKLERKRSDTVAGRMPNTASSDVKSVIGERASMYESRIRKTLNLDEPST